jgi:hypothetical protein
MAADLVATHSMMDHIGRFLPSVRMNGAAFSFVVDLIINYGSPVLHLVMVRACAGCGGQRAWLCCWSRAAVLRVGAHGECARSTATHRWASRRCVCRLQVFSTDRHPNSLGPCPDDPLDAGGCVCMPCTRSALGGVAAGLEDTCCTDTCPCRRRARDIPPPRPADHPPPTHTHAHARARAYTRR